MADRTVTDVATIQMWIDEHPRLKYLLEFEYKVPSKSVTSMRLDSDNNKIDVHAGRLYRFKAMSSMDVLRPSFADPSVLEKVLDPALSQAILVLLADYAS